MMYKQFLSILVVYNEIFASNAVKTNTKEGVRRFPDGLKFGAATASYQVEGAWDEDGIISFDDNNKIFTYFRKSGKYLGLYDTCATDDCSSGDVADDSYHLYKRDVEMMRELGLDFYRFSLSWPRILPNSFSNQINEAGVQYYNNLINEMLKYNIEPMVTLYHWDLPQKLQELGGWTNPYIVDWFGDYARVVYELFGDRVKNWITINEPKQICYQGYGDDIKAPRVNITGVADYICAKNLLLAHAKAFHIYDEEFRSAQGGVIGITVNVNYFEPETEVHADAAEETMEFDFGMYTNPIYGNGDFPQIVKEKVAAKSTAQGYTRSRLPEFSAEEVDYILGTADYFGINHYTTFLVYRNESVSGYYSVPSFYDDFESIIYQSNDWESGKSTWLKVVPWGFYKLLTRIRERYGNPPVYIFENGFSSSGGINDDDRVNYYRRYLDAMLDAIAEGSNIKGYTAWCLMDNFEWMRGYTERFGLYEVDYESPERTRTPRKSAFVYKEIIRTRSLDFNYVPDTTKMTIDEGH